MRINTVNEFIVTAIECEKKVANLYASIATLFKHVPNVNSLFIELYDDEKKHIEMLNIIVGRISEDGLSQAIDKEAGEFVYEALKCMEKDFIGGVSTLDDAYEVAHEIEAHEVMQAFKLFSLDNIPATARKRIVANQIDSHIEKVYKISNMYNKTIRKQMKAEYA